MTNHKPDRSEPSGLAPFLGGLIIGTFLLYLAALYIYVGVLIDRDARARLAADCPGHAQAGEWATIFRGITWPATTWIIWVGDLMPDSQRACGRWD